VAGRASAWAPTGFFFQGVIGGGRVSGWGHHGECGARAYNGGLGAEPPTGSRGRSGGLSPPEAESILVIGCPTLGATVMIWEKFMSKSRGVR